jgi:hypothetical protein
MLGADRVYVPAESTGRPLEQLAEFRHLRARQ